MTYYITNIDWDTNTCVEREKALHLPQDITVCSTSLKGDVSTDELLAESLQEYMSTLYGFAVNAFNFVDLQEVVGGERVN